MTHSLHRLGKKDELKNDYVILAMIATSEREKIPDYREKLLKIAEMLKSYKPTNIMPEFARKLSPVITAVFTDIETVKEILYKLKQEDLGISIVVSGLIDEIRFATKEVGLNMHTIHLSLGTFGKKNLLPNNPETLEITTMCGHHCTSPQSIEYYINLIKNNKITIEKAAEKLAKPCVCGIFNIQRAIEKLSELLKKNN
jgi:hypothetical protein